MRFKYLATCLHKFEVNIEIEFVKSSTTRETNETRVVKTAMLDVILSL
jgi:hypothetical protein